jgi:hypothetical protein
VQRHAGDFVVGLGGEDLAGRVGFLKYTPIFLSRSDLTPNALERWGVSVAARVEKNNRKAVGGFAKALLGQEASIDGHRMTNHETRCWRATPYDGRCDFFGLA